MSDGWDPYLVHRIIDDMREKDKDTDPPQAGDNEPEPDKT